MKKLLIASGLLAVVNTAYAGYGLPVKLTSVESQGPDLAFCLLDEIS